MQKREILTSRKKYFKKTTKDVKKTKNCWKLWRPPLINNDYLDQFFQNLYAFCMILTHFALLSRTQPFFTNVTKTRFFFVISFNYSLQNPKCFFLSPIAMGPWGKTTFTNEQLNVGKCDTNLSTAQKVSVFGVILVRIFPHSDWIRRDTEYLSVFGPNAEKCGPE